MYYELFATKLKEARVIYLLVHASFVEARASKMARPPSNYRNVHNPAVDIDLCSRRPTLNEKASHCRL